MPTTTSRASGHGHPRVTEAIARQARRLNTNLRYLHESAIELAERLIATCPPGPRHRVLRQLGLRGERPRVAPRDDRARGGAAGCARTSPTTASPRRSPRSRRRRGRAAGRRTMSRRGSRRTPPRGTDLDGGRVRRPRSTSWSTRGDAAGRGRSSTASSPATATSTVGPDLAETWLGRGATRRGAVDRRRGPGRPRPDRRRACGRSSTSGLDARTSSRIGKPMGNGHPVGAVITRREIAARLRRRDRVLQHVRRQPGVAMAAALAVLDVLEDERVLDADRGGRSRRSAPPSARPRPATTPCGDVRGVGLAIGVDVPRRRDGRGRSRRGCARAACSSARADATATC